MLAHTHSMISHVIVSNISKKKGIHLNERHFSWGSVKPDLVLPPFRPKHYMDETLDDIIEQIMDVVENVDVLSIKFSQRVGAITHFLTDFFTLPHSERWEWIKSGRTIEHIIYEKKLKRIAQEHPDWIRPKTLEIKRHANKKELKEWILYQHVHYKQQSDYQHDLLFASSVSQSITDWIISKKTVQESLV